MEGRHVLEATETSQAFFPLLECTCHTNQLTRVQTRVTGDANLLPADGEEALHFSLAWVPLAPVRACRERLLRAQGWDRKQERPEEENPASCLHVTIPNV